VEPEIGQIPFITRKFEEFRAWWDILAVRLISILTAGMGIINVLSSSTPALRYRLRLLETISPLEVAAGSRLATVLAGFALLLLSVNLWRRKQVAWMLTLAVLVISVLTHLLKGLDYEEASIAAFLGIGLFMLRFHFYARSDAPSVRQGFLVLLAATGFTLIYGITGFFLLDRHFSVRFSFPAAVNQTILMFTQFTNPGLEPVTGFGRYFADSIYIIAIATLGYSLFMLVRPVLVHQPSTKAERMQAQSIVESHGHSSLARFTLFDDKSYFFSSNDSVIAYVVKGRVALVLGDPIGLDENMSAVIQAFKDFCSRNDWGTSFYQVGMQNLDVYKTKGYQALSIGEEGIVDLNVFTLEGSAGKEFRNIVNRLNRIGHRVDVYEPPLSNELIHELKSVSEEWLLMTNGSELRFSLGWFDDDYVRNSVVAAVRSADGRISAFANLVPEYQRREVAIDLMRRVHHVENGTMEFMLVSIFEWAKKNGYPTFSLGLSALSGVGKKSDDPAVEHALGYIFDNVGRFYNFKGLHAFKDKFHPAWEPRYLIYRGAADLPAVAAALVRAHSGDNFLWASLKR